MEGQVKHIALWDTMCSAVHSSSSWNSMLCTVGIRDVIFSILNGFVYLVNGFLWKEKLYALIFGIKDIKIAITTNTVITYFYRTTEKLQYICVTCLYFFAFIFCHKTILQNTKVHRNMEKSHPWCILYIYWFHFYTLKLTTINLNYHIALLF